MLKLQEYRHSMEQMASNLEELRVSLWHSFIDEKYTN